MIANDDIKNPVPKDDKPKDITIEEFQWEYKWLKRHQSSLKSAYFNQTAPVKNVGSQNTIVSSYSLNWINKKER